MRDSNVFVVDTASKKIVNNFKVDDPASEAETLAKGYISDDDYSIKHIEAGTRALPKRMAIETGTKYIVYYLNK